MRKEIESIKINGITYLTKNGKKIKYSPWLGDLISFMYDIIMEKSIFPKKLDANMERHIKFLKKDGFFLCTVPVPERKSRNKRELDI